jgi:hypothetical protein
MNHMSHTTIHNLQNYCKQASEIATKSKIPNLKKVVKMNDENQFSAKEFGEFQAPFRTLNPTRTVGY